VFRIFRIVIEFPALDRLLDYLENTQNAQESIDAQTQRLKAITAALKAAISHEEK
jgi:hypothetical protein